MRLTWKFPNKDHPHRAIQTEAEKNGILLIFRSLEAHNRYLARYSLNYLLLKYVYNYQSPAVLSCLT